MKKLNLLLLFTILISTHLFSLPFNSKLTEEELTKINNGEVLIKNINYKKNMSLITGINPLGDELHKKIDDLKPKYLAEIIQLKPYKGNEDLPQKLEAVLKAIPDYVGIPYYSVRAEAWYDLYSSAVITSEETNGNIKKISADIEMEPFGIIKEDIEIKKDNDSILYSAINKNLLSYYDKFNCVWPEKLMICIYLHRDGDNWILYGVGGVNAPRIPFFTERIETSFINRIKTFCDYIFKQF